MVNGTNGHIIGRPVKEVDWNEFEKLCLLQCSITDICEWFHFSHQSLERKCKAHYGETFGQIFEKKRVNGLISLRRSLFKQAEHSAAVAIFLAKNYLGMKDVQEQSVDITTKGESIKPEYVTFPPDTIGGAKDILIKVLAPPISSN